MSKRAVINRFQLAQFPIQKPSSVFWSFLDDSKVLRRKNNDVHLFQKLCAAFQLDSLYTNDFSFFFVEDLYLFFCFRCGWIAKYCLDPCELLVKTDHICIFAGPERFSKTHHKETFDQIGFSLGIVSQKNIDFLIKRNVFFFVISEIVEKYFLKVHSLACRDPDRKHQVQKCVSLHWFDQAGTGTAGHFKNHFFFLYSLEHVGNIL